MIFSSLGRQADTQMDKEHIYSSNYVMDEQKRQEIKREFRGGEVPKEGSSVQKGKEWYHGRASDHLVQSVQICPW